jgi:hypothetical protein
MRGGDQLSTVYVGFDGTSSYYAALSVTSFRFTAAGTAWDTGVQHLRTGCFS